MASLELTPNGVEQTRAAVSFRTQAFIDGQFVDAQSGKRFVTENPATGESLAEIAECEAADVDAAVASARRAFDGGS